MCYAAFSQAVETASRFLDLDCRLQFMSEGGKRVMEVEDFGKLKGCPWPDFWTGDGNSDAKRAVEIAKAGSTVRFRGHANTAKGNPRYWDVQVSSIVGIDGRPNSLCFQSLATLPRNGAPPQS